MFLPRLALSKRKALVLGTSRTTKIDVWTAVPRGSHIGARGSYRVYKAPRKNCLCTLRVLVVCDGCD